MGTKVKSEVDDIRNRRRAQSLQGREPRLFYPVDDAAYQLGIHRSTLHRLAQEHALYAPSVQGFPGASYARSRTAYHRRHLELIAAVRLGAMDADEAMLRWKIERGRIRVTSFGEE